MDKGIKSWTISCDITNTGEYDAYETPQLYVRQLSGDLARPICELKGFEKIFIPAGETRTVSFALTPDQLGYWHEEKDGFKSRVWFATDKTNFEVWIAPASRSARGTQKECILSTL
jgi:beta-glucosidase